MRYLAILFLALNAFAGDSVSLTQKGSAVTITVNMDVTAILADHSKQLADNEMGRATSLSRVTLTASQIAAENAKYDAQAEAIKRSTQLKFFDVAMKDLQLAQTRASISDTDAAKALSDAKAKIDADAVKQDALKPTVDADISK